MDHAGPVAFIRFGTLQGVPDCFISKGTNDAFIAIDVYTHWLAAWLRCQGRRSPNGGWRSQLETVFWTCEVWMNKCIEGQRPWSFSFHTLHLVILLMYSASLASAAATGRNKMPQSLDSTSHVIGHHFGRLILVSGEWCEEGGQGKIPFPRPGLLWTQEDRGGVGWDDTSTNSKPVTGWWRSHNDGSQHLILHFKADKPCAIAGDMPGNVCEQVRVRDFRWNKSPRENSPAAGCSFWREAHFR